MRAESRIPVLLGLRSFVLAGAVTIDAGNDASNLLSGIRTRYNTAGSHRDGQEALSNCLAPVPGDAAIVGFGNRGIIVTGTGDRKRDSSRYIALSNVAEWKETLRTLTGARAGAVSRLILCSCHTGAGEPGAQLVFELANATGAMVLAPTGAVFFDGTPQELRLQRGAKWQSASPGTRPKAIPPPTLLRSRIPEEVFYLRFLSGFQPVKLADMLSVDIAPSGLRGTGARDWQNLDTSVPLKFIHFSAPVAVASTPLALVTGSVTLKWIHGGREEIRSFRILNDMFLQDETFPDTLYHAEVDRLLGAP